MRERASFTWSYSSWLADVWWWCIEEGAALLGFGGALREEVPLVLRRHPGVTPGLPHMRLADIEGVLRHERAPPCTILCEGGPLGEGERQAVRVLEANILEVALERPAISHLLSARGSWSCVRRGRPRARCGS